MDINTKRALDFAHKQLSANLNNLVVGQCSKQHVQNVVHQTLQSMTHNGQIGNYTVNVQENNGSFNVDLQIQPIFPVQHITSTFTIGQAEISVRTIDIILGQ